MEGIEKYDLITEGVANRLTDMIVKNTPPDVACKILGIEPTDPLYAEVIERSTLKAFSDKCAVLTKVSEGYTQHVTTTTDNDKGGFTTKVEEKVFPPDIKALQLLVDLYNGYSPGRVQKDLDEVEQLVVQFVDDLDDEPYDIEVEPSKEDFL
jgi:hypothetical protein